MSQSLIYAHRGASGYAPENTLEAFELAIAQGADGVELDVHLTRDKQVVVAHDEHIDRVSDGTGLIANTNLAELKKHLFNKPHPLYEKATIPTLQEVLELLAPSGLQVNIELKNSRILYEGLEQKCLELVHQMGMFHKVVFSSFNHHSMQRLKALDQKARCGLLYDCCLISPLDYAKGAGMNAVHPNYLDLLHYPEDYAQARQKGLMVNVWTVNDDKDMKRILRSEVDVLITNYPDRALAVRDSLAVSV